MGARETALSVLITCRRNSAWPNTTLKDFIRRDKLDSRDAALAARLCYGVLQNRGKLDWYLKQLSGRRIKDFQPILRDILHIGLYQICMMDKIPESAAVNESVNIAKKHFRSQKNAAGLVNAILRNAIRSQIWEKEPESLAEKYSHPQKLIDFLKANIGKEKLEPMLLANNGIPDTVIQVNTRKISPEKLLELLISQNISAKMHDWMPNCLVLSGTGDLEQTEVFKRGYFYVQDCAARLSVMCAQLPGNQKLWILDCCAAPGGKSFAAAMDVNDDSEIISCDIYEHKTALIRSGANRLGLKNIEVLQRDATTDVVNWHSSMDCVIADVPCSGYGIIRKKPDIRFKDPDTMKQLPELQLNILRQQAKYVKPGGTLIYSTCTLVRAENEDVVTAFLKDNADFTLEPLQLPDVFLQNTSGMLTLIPGEYDTDGFFIARLRRKS